MNRYDFAAIKGRLRGFFGEPNLTDNTGLIDSHLLDSPGMLELALLIEDVYGVEVFLEDITRENFATIDKIARYILRRTYENCQFEE